MSSNRTEQVDISREEMYREWLGLKDAAPSYYGLLGLPELETDVVAVQHAGRRVKRKLRAYQIGLYRKHALELLAEVGQAVSVLANPEKKRAYDADLMKRMRAVAEELFRVHCEGKPRDATTLEAWLTACQLRRVPVTRVLPYLMKEIAARGGPWPTQGEHELPLPINLWIYRDAVAIGQCLHLGLLEKRVEAVKHVQKLLGIPEGLARLVAEEVGRSLHLFAQARLVIEAKKNPEAVLLRLGRRVRRYGGQLRHHAKVMAAVAMLLGKHKRDLEQAMARLDDPPVELTPAQATARATRRAKERIKEARQQVVEARHLATTWVVDRPQILVGLALLTGLVVLVLAVLVAVGLWYPWPVTPVAPTPPQPPAVGPPGVKTTPSATGSPVAAPADPESSNWMGGLEKYFEKYGVGQGTAPSPSPPEPPAEPPLATGTNGPTPPILLRPPKNPSGTIRFFNLGPTREPEDPAPP